MKADSGSAEPVEKWAARAYQKAMVGINLCFPLAVAIQTGGKKPNWPTPTTAPDAPNSNANRKEGLNSLSECARIGSPMWPTPCATDHKGSGQTGDLRDRLDYAVDRGGTKTRQTYPTPTTKDNATAPSMMRWPANARLREKLFPTPRACDGSKPPMGNAHHQGLEAVAKKWATPTASTGGPEPDGKTGRKLSTQAQGQLNPDWVEWLMGWPVKWTSLDPLPEANWRAWELAFRSGSSD